MAELVGRSQITVANETVRSHRPTCTSRHEQPTHDPATHNDDVVSVDEHAHPGIVTDLINDAQLHDTSERESVCRCGCTSVQNRVWALGKSRVGALNKSCCRHDDRAADSSEGRTQIVTESDVGVDPATETREDGDVQSVQHEEATPRRASSDLGGRLWSGADQAVLDPSDKKMNGSGATRTQLKMEHDAGKLRAPTNSGTCDT